MNGSVAASMRARAVPHSTARGSIDTLPSRALRVRMYAGTDPLTGRQLDLTGSTTDKHEARKLLTRLQAQLDEQRNARTKATLGTALDVWCSPGRLATDI